MYKYTMVGFVLFFLLTLSLQANTSDLSSEGSLNKGPQVLASIRPLALLAEAVVGDRGGVSILLADNVSPHHYSLKISERQQLVSADVVLWVGAGLEGFLEKPLAPRAKNTITAMTLEGMQWPEDMGAEQSTDENDPHHGHDHGDHDPHLWLNPMNNLVIVDALVTSLEQLAPQHATYYRDNAKKIKAALQQLDQQLQTTMIPLKNESFIVAHPAYNHFVARYGLQAQSYINLTPSRHAGARHLYELRQQSAAHCVFQDEGFPSVGAVKLAKDLGVPLKSLDPLGARISISTAAVSEDKPAGIILLLSQIGQDFQDCLQSKKP